MFTMLAYVGSLINADIAAWAIDPMDGPADLYPGGNFIATIVEDRRALLAHDGIVGTGSRSHYRCGFTAATA